MSKAKKGVGPAKRFGVRYGLTNRQRVGVIEAEQKKDHKCPYCHFSKVSRDSVGIWSCGKCGSRFTAKAYKPIITKKLKTETSKNLISEASEEEIIVEEEDYEDNDFEKVNETEDIEESEDLEDIEELDDSEDIEEEPVKSKKKSGDE